jgi:uracil-DNA glycosylase
MANNSTNNINIRVVGRTVEFKDYDDYIDNYCAPSWKPVFEAVRAELQHVWTMINMPNNKGTDDCPFYPPLQQVFRCFDLTPLPTVRVVILGQDPYPGTDSGLPQACGLAFSVRKGMKPPSSLKNIFTELCKQYPEELKPTDGDLTQWAKQGVLLLNTALTCKPSTEGSHIKFYRGFIDKIIRAIVRTNPNCIFLLWGAKAQAAVPDSIQGFKLKCTHPSGISYADTRPECGTFKDNKHFLSVNQQLQALGLEPIKWLQFTDE